MTIAAQDALAEVLDPETRSAIAEQLAVVLPVAVFVAVLLYVVYNLGLGAGRTIGRLERAG